MFNKIKALLRFKGFRLFTRLHELNIVGLRSRSVQPNRFDDELHVFYMVSPGKWQYHVFRITTDPGTYWLKNPLAPQGTAILPEGQYLNTWVLGLHQGKYKALVQAKPLSVLRDYDRNAVLDFYNGKKYTGMFGINIHRANATGITKTVDKYSAGCQVFENAADFEVFLKLCETHKAKYGNQFSYSLIDFRTVRRRRLRLAAIGLGVSAALGISAYYYFNKPNINRHEQFS